MHGLVITSIIKCGVKLLIPLFPNFNGAAWSLVLDNKLYPAVCLSMFFYRCNYLSMLGFALIHMLVNEAPGGQNACRCPGAPMVASWTDPGWARCMDISIATVVTWPQVHLAHDRSTVNFLLRHTASVPLFELWLIFQCYVDKCMIQF